MKMSGRTLRDVKRDLAAAYPDVVFTYGTSGRGHDRGHHVSWVGGPDALRVNLTASTPWRSVYHFERIMTDEEQAVHDAASLVAWDAWDAWVAAKPERDAAHAAQIKANREQGRVLAAATRARKAERLAMLSNAYPGVTFTLTKHNVAWVDGPDVGDVATMLGMDKWQCQHTASPAWKAQTAILAEAMRHSNRLTRRLAQSPCASYPCAAWYRAAQ